MKILFFISTTLIILWIIWKIRRRERRDWKEYIPYYKRIIDKAGEEADKILEEKFLFKGDGYCYNLWELQQEILKEKYNINWKSPADLNEHILYD